MSGSRKLIISLIGMGLVFAGILSGKISGDTGAWSIVSIIGAAMGGYAGEYLLGRKVGTNGGPPEKNPPK